MPSEYEIKLTFQSGDYQSRNHQITSLKRSKVGAGLVRTFSTRTSGVETTEEWYPFTVEDADRTARAIAYLINHPWLLNDEREIDRRFKKGAASFEDPRMKGRESFSMYYPSTSFSMQDGKGNIWWNDDPWSWRGENERRYLWAAQHVLSSVYPFVVSIYPETKRSGEATGGRLEGDTSAGQRLERRRPSACG